MEVEVEVKVDEEVKDEDVLSRACKLGFQPAQPFLQRATVEGHVGVVVTAVRVHQAVHLPERLRCQVGSAVSHCFPGCRVIENKRTRAVIRA